MKGRLVDLSVGMNGKQRVTIELDTDFREQFDGLYGAELEVTVKRWKERRSKDANALFHALVNEIARVKGLPDSQVKVELVTEYGVLARDSEGGIVGFKLPPSVDVGMIYPYTKLYKTVTEGGKTFNCYLVYTRSSEMDTTEFSKLIDGAIAEAEELGIDTDTPYLKSLKGE